MLFAIRAFLDIIFYMRQENLTRKLPLRLGLPGAILALATYPIAGLVAWFTNPQSLLAYLPAQIIAGALLLGSLIYFAAVWQMGAKGKASPNEELSLRSAADFATALAAIVLVGALAARIFLHAKADWINMLACIYLMIWGIWRNRYFMKIMREPRPGYYCSLVADQLFRTLIVINLAAMCAVGKTILPGLVAFATTMVIFPILTFIENKSFK